MSATDRRPRRTLAAEKLVKAFHRRTVVADVTIHLEAGEVVGLLGPNGAGKTTTFYMVLGLLRPDGGWIVLNGQDITHLPVFQRARLGLGFLPQEPSIFRKLTVEENLMAILETLEIPRAERVRRREALLD